MTLAVNHYSSSLSEQDMSACALLYVACFSGPPRFEAWTKETAEDFLKSLLGPHTDFIVAQKDGRICGFGVGIPLAQSRLCPELVELGATADSYYFAELAVAPEFRGHGIGKRLQIEREAQARSKGFTNLSVRVRADNTVTIHMLQSLGFSESGRYVAVNADSSAERLVLVKKLG